MYKDKHKSFKNIRQKYDPLHVIKEHRMLEERVRHMQIEYRAALERARLTDDQNALIRVLEKDGLRDLLSKCRPPVTPSVSFFQMPFPPFPRPVPPDPHELAKIFFDPSRIYPVRRLTYISHSCNSRQNQSVNPTEFIDSAAEGSASCSQVGPKSVSSHASAGQSTPGQPLLSRASCGFRSLITVPAGNDLGPTIVSTLNSSLSWVEANTYGTVSGVGGVGYAVGGGGYAKVAATASLSVFVENDVISPAPRIIVSGEVSGQDQIYYETNVNVGSELSASVSLPTGGPYEVFVDELVELAAEASNGHAFIDGSFTWDPLAVEIREGCHMFTWVSPLSIPGL